MTMEKYVFINLADDHLPINETLYSHGKIIYIIILKLSAHPPHSVFVPCINIEPGPSHHAADAYKIEIGVKPINLLSGEVSSCDITQKI